MSSFFSNMRTGFGRQNSKGTLPARPGAGNQSPTGFGQAMSTSQPDLNGSPMPSPSQPGEMQMNYDSPHRRPPLFFREQWANLIVKGNFMTLAAKPVLIEEGEWLAHQVVEQNRLLDGMIKITQETDRNTGTTICNATTCPSMTAGPGITYTFETNRNSVRVPAPQYISYVQRWIAGKVTDPSIFPTETFTGPPPSLASISSSTIASSPSSQSTPDNWVGKASGFPSSFPSDIRNIYRQMLRCYAHIYHAHWLDFYNLSAYKELNTCFIHFVNVGRLFGLINDRDLEPMMPLVEIWLEKGWLPRPNGSVGSASGVTSQGQSRSGSLVDSSMQGGSGGNNAGGGGGGVSGAAPIASSA